MKRKLAERLWEEFHNSPSAHAAANLGHALRGVLADVDKITGVISPTRYEHKTEVTLTLQKALQGWVSRLNQEEQVIVEWLIDKAEGGETAQEVNVVELAFERWKRHGTLLDASAEIVEVPDYPPNELEAGGKW
jgi:hypothetical protein